MNDQFLKSIHAKINKKQNFNYGLTFSISFFLMVMMTYSSMYIINEFKLNLDWQQYEKYQFAEESYEWEIVPEISNDDIYQYLIEEMDIFHLIEELSEEEQHILIKKIKLEG